MARRVTIAKKVTVPAGVAKEEAIYRVPVATKFTVEKFMVHFPTGNNYMVSAVLMHGIKQVCPEEGELYGDNALIPAECSYQFLADEVVSARLVNSDSTNPHTVLIIVIGTVEERGG